MVVKFTTAKRQQLKASILIEGLSGSGKSGLALLLGYYLSGEDWSKVFHIDTENESANLFAGIPFSNGANVGEFNVGELTEDIGFKPSNYLAFRKAAVEAGAEAVIEDSISHAWSYKGGVLDMVNQAAARSRSNDKYGAWRDESVAAEKNNLLPLLRDRKCHVIATVRVKERFEYITGDDGKNKLQSLGEQQIQQGELKYEPDLVLHMEHPGSKNAAPIATVTKSRYAILETGESYEFTPELCRQLAAYLKEGADPAILLEEQRQEYIKATKAFLDAHPNAKTIWKVIKSEAGFAETPIDDIPIDAIKQMYMRITE